MEPRGAAGPTKSAPPPGPGLHGTLFSAMQDAVLYARYPDRRVLDVNDAFLDLFGLTRDEALHGTTEPFHVDAARYAALGAMMDDKFRRGEPVSVDWTFRRKDGSTFLAHLVASPVGPYRGEPIGAITVIRDVSTDKATSRQLDLQSLVLESMIEGVSLSSEDGFIVYTNAAEDAIFGYERGELIGKHLTVMNAYPPEKNARIVQETVRHLRERGYWEGDFENVRKDGTPFFTHARITRLDVEGKPHWLCVQEDITTRRTLEDRERANNRALKTLMRVQEELASNLDLDRVVQAATDAATIVSGAEFGAFFYNVVRPDGEAYTLYTLSGAHRDAFAGFAMPRKTAVFGPTFRGEGIVRSDDITKDPRYGKNAPHHGMPEGHLPVRSYLAVPVVSREGHVHGGLFLGHSQPARFAQEAEQLVTAIAAQAAIAIDNATLYRRARESEERWRGLVETAPAQIATLDATGRIITINRSVTGESPADLAGTRFVDLLAPEERERAGPLIESAAGAGQAAEFEARALAAGSEERWLLVRVAPIGQGGMGAVLIANDVTHRRLADSEIARMRAQLIQGEKLSALGSLVSGVAHELRTPLTFLANNSFLAQHRLHRAAARGASAAEALEEMRGFLAEITTGVDRINQLVEDLRRYTKARQDPELATAPLQSMVADAVELFRATNRARHRLETSLSPTATVRANKGALQQLVLNLLQNAADASEPSQPIRIVTRNEPKGVVLEVTDRGSGIPPSVVERMFEPLFTTKPEGTGLGLAIVKRIVDEHRAIIEVDTVEREGTTFRVLFPAA